VKDMDLKIKAASFLATGAALLTAASPALANSITINKTGSGSNNEANVDIVNTADINHSHMVDVNNDLALLALTGGNTADDNTGDATITGGGFRGRVNLTTPMMEDMDWSNVLSSLLSSSHHDGSIDISNTGANSDNTVDLSVDNDLDVDVTHELNVDNNVEALIDSGGNSASNNTGDARINTGRSSFDLTIK
jgi:hypothetical protein